jgi:hypothetical protein
VPNRNTQNKKLQARLALSINNNNKKNGRKRNNKSARGNTSIPLVTALARLSSSKKTRQSIIPRESKNIASYKSMIVDPFRPTSNGCRLPDPWSFPTETYKLQNYCTLTSPGSTSAGSVIFLPHPNISIFDYSLFINGTSQMGFNNYHLIASNGIAALSTPTLMANVLSTWRVVGGGVKIRCTMPEANRTGRIYFVPFPLAQLPGYNALSTTTMSSTSLGISQMTGNYAAVGSAILEVPGSFAVTCNELSDKEIILRFKPHSDQVCSFKNAQAGINQVYSSSLYESTEIVSGTGGTVAAPQCDTAANYDCSGWNGWMMVYEGLPVNNNCFLFEQVLHLEGTPVLTSLSSAGASPLPTHQYTEPKERSSFSKVFDYISNIPLQESITIMENVNNVYQRLKPSGSLRLTNY